MKVIIDSLMEVIKDLDFIKKHDLNLISIRDFDSSPFYDIIDNAGIKNILVVQFDDLVEELPPEYNRKERPPDENDISTILKWARQKMFQLQKDSYLQHFLD